MLRSFCALVALAIAGCGAEASIEAPHARSDARSELPGGDMPEPPPRLSDANGAVTLRLPEPGASRREVLRDVPECREQIEPEGERCRFHGWMRPLSSPCEGGCTWWTYRFDGEVLDVAELERSAWDLDAERARGFAAEADLVARELTRRLGAPPRADVLARWDAVESRADGARVLLERRTWEVGELMVTWSLAGRAGHHPGATLEVRVERAHPDELRVEMREPELATGAPLLRLRGGPVPRPLDVPLWLTFDDRDRADGECSLHHEAVVFPLPDERIYVGQYNSWCGSARTCRVIDPRSGAGSEPRGGCLWGEGIHHRARAIGDGYVLWISDAEGGGAVDVVRYDPEVGAALELRLSISATAPLRVEVRDGGVDFATVCEVPPGCEHRDYRGAPLREYRWTPSGGLAAR